MTTIELLNAIINGNEITDEMRAKATEIKEKAQAKASSKSAKEKQKKAEENAPLLAKVREYLATTKAAGASEVGTAIGVSTPKATALLKVLVANEEVTSVDGKVGKNKCKVYSLKQ